MKLLSCLLLLLACATLGCADAYVEGTSTLNRHTRGAAAPDSMFAKHAVASRTCAPWDGPAVQVTLSPKPLACEQVAYPLLTFSVWKPVEEVSGKTFSFPDATGQVGAVVSCPKPDEYRQAKSGWIRFDAIQVGNPIQGEFDVEFEDGRHEHGRFEAEWCDNAALCG